MAQATLDQWQVLYDQADRLKERKPWNIFMEIDLISIEVDGYREPYYCIFTGRDGNNPGVGVFYGMKGLGDLTMMIDSYLYHTPGSYVLGDITACFCYFGNEEELEDGQKKLIKSLGLTYQGKNDWTYFQSFEPRYMPVHLSKEEVEVCTKIFTSLNRMLDYVEENSSVLPEFEKGNILRVNLDPNHPDERILDSIPMPYAEPRYYTVRLPDDKIEELKEIGQSDAELAIDLNYLFIPINDPNFDRPLNPLLVIAYDLKQDLILNGNLLQLEEDEVDEVLTSFIRALEIQGIPKKLYLRNPRVLYALDLLCEKLGIEIVRDPLQEMDDIIENLSENI